MVKRKQLIEQFAMNMATLYRQMMKSGQSVGDGLSRPQFHALMLLKRQTLTVKELARLMDTGSSAATQLVNHLDTGGWIERQTDAADARVTRLRLSENGLARLREIKRNHLRRLDKLFEGISDEDLVDLTRITGKLAGKNYKERQKETA